MCHALEIYEIPLNIFDHRRLPYQRIMADLLALVRMCHAFREPTVESYMHHISKR